MCLYAEKDLERAYLQWIAQFPVRGVCGQSLVSRYIKVLKARAEGMSLSILLGHAA